MKATLYAQRASGNPINAPNASHGDGGASLGANDKRDSEAELNGVDCDNSFTLVRDQPTEGRASSVV